MLKTKKVSPFALFFILWGLFSFASLIVLLITRGSVLNSIILSCGDDRFMDFFNHIQYCDDPSAVYFVSPHACFPPLAYGMYFLFNRILPAGSVTNFQADQTGSYALLLFVFYNVILSVLLFYAIRRNLKSFSAEKCLAVIAASLFANFFIFGVLERGNSTFIVVVLLLLAMNLKESENRAAKEAALVLIAVSAGLKIYPALFGLFYLKEKRYREAVRLIVYGVVLFFFPFVFFGGFAGLKQFFRNQSAVQIDLSGKGLFSFNAFLRLISFSDGDVLWTKLAALAIGAGMLLIFFLCPLSKWEEYFLISAMMILLPLWSGYYTMIYLLLPFIAFLNFTQETEKGKCTFLSVYFPMGLFAYLFSLTVFAFKASDHIDYVVLYVMLILVIADGIKNLVKDRKDAKKEI